MKLIIKLIETAVLRTVLGLINITVFGSITERILLIFLFGFFLIGLYNNLQELYICSSILFILMANSKVKKNNK